VQFFPECNTREDWLPRVPVFWHSGKIASPVVDVSTADDDDDDEWTERSADSSVDSWSASKVAWPAAMGSRFWALAAEDSSGEESSTEKDTCISNGMIKPGFAGATYVANNGVESE
jgi:hypothetical protein